MNRKLFGNTSSLKPSQHRSLLRLLDRRVPPDHLISAPLARDLLDLSAELNRQIGLFINRQGSIESVTVGNAHRLQLPEFNRVRGAQGRLRGIRLVITHLVPDPLNREELADLAKLKFDLTAAIHRGPGGIQVDAAHLQAPDDERQGVALHILDRAPLRHVAPESPAALTDAYPAYPFNQFIYEIEQALVARTSAAQDAGQDNRAIVMMVHKSVHDLDARISEMRELCRTAGVHVVELITQRRPNPDPRTFFGTGKLDDVLVQALEQDVDMLICDPELSASQAKTISARTDLNVIDRTMLILDIFAQHAQSSDGKLQVELAQLRYRLPKLVGRGTMMSRLAGGVGGRGPGETKLEIDRRRAKDRISDLERRLTRLSGQRAQRRHQRERSEVPVVAVVGYTNAGKSTFLNTVTESEVRAENKLFATLDPTVRRIRFPREREVVLLDTVGFIRDLPPALMQAFSATLEEISQADLILHLVDVSDPDMDQQIAVVEEILRDLDAGSIPRWRILNKCDKLEASEQRLGVSASGDIFRISALDRKSTRPLMLAIEAQLWTRPSAHAAKLPQLPVHTQEQEGQGGQEKQEDPEEQSSPYDLQPAPQAELEAGADLDAVTEPEPAPKARSQGQSDPQLAAEPSPEEDLASQLAPDLSEDLSEDPKNSPGAPG